MVALAGTLGGLHVTQQRIHFGNAQPPVGTHRAMAGHGRQQFIARTVHPPAVPMLTQVGQAVDDRGGVEQEPQHQLDGALEVAEEHHERGHDETQTEGEDRLKDDGISEELITHVADRLGPDRRYGIDPTKIKEDLGWYPETPFEKGIVLTIDWYLAHPDWMAHVTSGDYQKYYEQMYKNK